MLRRIAVVCLLTILLCGCRSEPADEPDATPNALVQGNNQFAFDLYATLRNDREGNLFFSPHCIATALAMTYAGAAGDTERQMANVLHSTVPQEELHAAFASLTKQLLTRTKQDGYELQIANRLWGQVGHNFRTEFLQITRDDYCAELGQLDFVNQVDTAKQTINAWVEKETQGKIKVLIPKDELDKDTRLVLTNAIYFKGTWTYKFEREQTHDARFNLSATNRVNVPMMNQQGVFRLASTKDFQVLEMPYRGGRLAMLVLLPAKIDGLAELEGNLTDDHVRKWISELRPQRARVSLPRFTATSQFQLADALKSMGMHDAFDLQRADFSGMDGMKDLYLSAVIHKAYVDVDEAGTTAAAATAGEEKKKSEMESFRADHPFVFLIRDHRTGSILFLGRVVNPTLVD